MWILTPSITSAFAAATGASTSASSEQLAAAFARSLLSRSKPSPQRTWLQRLKRDSWTTHLSGAISSDSLGESFTDWWTSSLAATRASHSAQPANASALKTHDTSGHLSQTELLSCDQQPVSLRMSRDISRWGCPTLSKTWQEWVTERRGAWRQRVNAARLTSGSGSLSWPTASARDHKDCSDPATWKCKEKRNRYDQLGRAVFSDAANGPTPNAQVSQDGESPETWLKRKEAMKAKGYNGNGCGTPLTIAVQLHGQAAPASSSLLGSRQGLWPTITAHTPDMESNGPNGHQGTYLAGAVKQWATPRAEDSESCGMRHGRGVADTLTAQTRTWATPKTPTGGPETAKRKQELGRTASGGGDLASQANGKLNQAWVCCLMGVPMGWVDPLCPVSVIKNWPRFVTGWVRPQTAQIPCDSSAMELCRPAQSGRSEFSLASCGKEPTK